MKYFTKSITCLISSLFLFLIMGTAATTVAAGEFKSGVYGNETEDTYYTFWPDGSGRLSLCTPDGDCGHFTYFNWTSIGENAELIYEYSPWKKEGSKETFKPETGSGENRFTLDKDLTAAWLKSHDSALDRDYKARLKPGTYYKCDDNWRDCPKPDVLEKKDNVLINEDLTGYIEEKGQRQNFVISIFDTSREIMPNPPSFVINYQESDEFPLFGYILRGDRLQLDLIYFCPLAPCQ